MSSENKFTEKPFDFSMIPFFGVEFGERMGELSAGQQHMRSDIQRLETRIDVLDTKTDKMAHMLNRLDERTKSMQNQILAIGGATLAAVIAGIILQYLK